MISYEDFKKIELTVATILSVERIEGSDKLLKLQIEIGKAEGAAEKINNPSENQEVTLVPEPKPALRQLVSGIGKKYAPENLIGKQIIVVTNLEPKMLMGLESQGMLLAAGSEEGPVLLTVMEPINSGAKIK